MQRLAIFEQSKTSCYFGCYTPTLYYGYDGHGSVRFLTDDASTPNIKDTYDYDAYGNLVATTGTDYNPFLFAGEQYDADLGLYYNRARYLDVRVGRFWGMDTRQGVSSGNPGTDGTFSALSKALPSAEADSNPWGC